MKKNNKFLFWYGIGVLILLIAMDVLVFNINDISVMSWTQLFIILVINATALFMIYVSFSADETAPEPEHKVTQDMYWDSAFAELKQYHIFHAINQVYMFKEIKNQQREWVMGIKANSMEEAFTMAQDFHPDWPKTLRSTSVGDAISGPEGLFMVKGTGFELIENRIGNREEPYTPGE